MGFPGPPAFRSERFLTNTGSRLLPSCPDRKVVRELTEYGATDRPAEARVMCSTALLNPRS